jgi:hypothetical protein
MEIDKISSYKPTYRLESSVTERRVLSEGTSDVSGHTLPWWNV